jgi:hypothetical protein
MPSAVERSMRSFCCQVSLTVLVEMMSLTEPCFMNSVTMHRLGFFTHAPAQVHKTGGQNAC